MYDVIIIGCGPAGMTAGIYMSRAGKKVLILEKETIGGQMASSPLIENYPGYTSISGSELANSMYEQANNLGVEIELDEAKKIEVTDTVKVIGEDNIYEGRSLIIATGSKYRLLGLDNEINLIGKGIHFCVSCDGAFYKNKTVAVIGGGNSAVVNALALSEYVKKVYLIQDLDHLTAEDALITKLHEKNNVEVILSSKVKEIIGEEELKSIKISTNGIDKEISLDGMFISIGLIPQSVIVKDILPLNKYGYIETSNCKTSIPGVFVAGDCRDKAVKQITVATSDGTIAAMGAIEYLNEKKVN